MLRSKKILTSYLKYNLKKYKIEKYIVKFNILEIVNQAIELMNEYVLENISQIIHCELFDIAFEYVHDILIVQYVENDLLSELYNLSKERCKDIVYKSVKIAQSLIFKFFIPKRAYKKSYIRKNNNNLVYFKKIDKQINYLKSIPQPEQRTDEWYIFRNSTMTASNIWKIFISDYSQTQLILEKCEPININKFKNTNLNSPMHWGQKYEPVSVLYYEYINNTRVTDFGCIPHKDYSFIAASPDGIVCDTSSKLFGRMLEIKNVVSREITGIPKMEYWIQMQIQMEVCDLNECDFLEMKFTEYLEREEYILDIEPEYKGTILQFMNKKTEEPHYVYAPFLLSDIESSEYKEWVEKSHREFASDSNIEYIKTLYWKLEKISCILVLRNKFWFNTVLPDVEFFWNNLVDERETEKYKERYSKKRKLQLEDQKSRSDFPKPGCLIDVKNL